MSIMKQPYELSIWDEKLLDNGHKEETKRAIIGAHDMDYLGRAINIKLTSKINGTHTLTFSMYDSFFDSAGGEYVHNEFVDNICNEKKIKLLYKDEWLEFYVKEISESKNHQGLIISYECTDAFIEELSRNGYGITFDTELYNNVEEIGTFTETILEDSIWHYNNRYNWGDFTEYTEEKLFRIPVSYFNNLVGYKLRYDCCDELIENIYTGETRKVEMGDDKARELKYFWDNGEFDNGYSLTGGMPNDVPNDGYIYVPYSCLNFCYINTDNASVTATEVPAQFGNSYALAPSTIDPSSLIQFLAFPQTHKLEVDENGLLLNKDCHYVMTVQQWNDSVNTDKMYLFEGVSYKMITDFSNKEQYIYGNKIVGYDGYFEQVFEHDGYNDGTRETEIRFGKKISVTDRTECNISEDINQFVKVYQNRSDEYLGCYNNEEWLGDTSGYRVCSKIETRNVIPQLARNYTQNGDNITTVNGWDVMKLYDGSNIRSYSSKIEVGIEYEEDETTVKASYLSYTPMNLATDEEGGYNDNEYYTIINFGVIGQELEISSDKIYCLGWNMKHDSACSILIGEGTTISSGEYSFKDENKVCKINVTQDEGFMFFKSNATIKNPYICLRSRGKIRLNELQFFEAYTKGIDFFKNGIFKYSGRNLFNSYVPNENELYRYSDLYTKEKMSNIVIFETDVMEGDSYEITRYFIQQLKKKDGSGAYDTFMAKKYLDEEGHETYLPLDAGSYTEEDYEIVTNYIDLNNCAYYDKEAKVGEFDCSWCGGERTCLYQKYGYCPYRFKTQKHCRKIRTLSGSKSNRFNLTQELSKVFEIYPIYYTRHYNNGKVIYTDDVMDKFIFYITEKGKENKLGFRYESNLSNISRSKSSKEIITKLYVDDVDSSLSKTGLCSIKTAEDNPSKDNFIIDFSYYNKMGLLDETTSNADLYGINSNDKGYLKTLGYYNEEYDKISNKIINLQDSSLNELEANLYVNLEGIETAQKELIKIRKQMDRFLTAKKTSIEEKPNQETNIEENDTYKSYKEKHDEQYSILIDLIKTTFYDENGTYCLNPTNLEYLEKTSKIKPDEFLEYNGTNFSEIKENWVDTNKYTEFGMLGQRNKEFKQIQEWKKERSKYLKDINRISLNFYQHYEPYLKEGTWTDSNYLSDNSYYHGAKEVAKKGAIPNVSYNIAVVDLYSLPNHEEYRFDIADTTYVEDVGMFGYSKKTGMPNRLRTLITEITNNLDSPSSDSIKVQNYTTQFEDLFQQVTASVQSLQFNENIYKRSSNFTSTKAISNTSLQGALDTNDLTLISTDENNISIDSTGQSGSDINNHSDKYKLDGQGLKFSNDGGQSWNIGVGPSGINADYIKLGSIDTSKIQLIDNEYLYFLWDKSGISAYRNPTTSSKTNPLSDFARFNKYGLSLVENGIIRLRTGYKFNGENGKYNSEKEIGTDTNIGFYLYSDKGKLVFSTESDKNSARLALGGEMYISDSLETVSAKRYEFSDFVLSARKSIATEFSNVDTNTNKYFIEEFLLDFNKIYSNEEIEEKEYSLNDGHKFKIETGLLDEDFVYEKDTENYYLTKYIYITFNEYEYINGEISEISTITSGLIKIDNIIKQLTKNKKTIKIETNEELEKAEMLVDYSIINNDVILKYDGELFYGKENVENVYEIEINSVLYLYKNKEIKESEKEYSDDAVGIFINNQSINSEKTTNGLTRRLWSCVSKTEDGYANILTVLNTGELFMGGNITEKDINNTTIVSNKLSEFSDFIEIEETDQSIKITKNGISIGKIDLMSYIQSEVEKVTKSIYLVSHSHGIGGAAVESKEIKELKGSKGFKETSTKTENPYSLTGSIDKNDSDTRIVLTGRSKSTGTYSHFYIPIKDFIEAITLQIKEDARTTTEGKASASGGGSFTGYYVEYLGG